jgi:hypothetical protein
MSSTKVLETYRCALLESWHQKTSQKIKANDKKTTTNFLMVFDFFFEMPLASVV